MKATKIFSLMLCCMAVLSFTACIDDDDNNNGPTPEERRAAYQAMQGRYVGKAIYMQAKPGLGNDRTDTLDVSWQVNTDSVMIVDNFPAAVVAEHIQDAELAGQIAQQPAQRVKLFYALYNVSPVTFLVNPASITYNVDYNGGKHDVTVAFYVNSSNSYGVFNSTGKVMEMQIVPGGVYVDHQLKSDLLPSVSPVLLTGKAQ